MRFGLNEDLIRFIEERRERWYHKYDNDAILRLTESENDKYWKRIYDIESFSKYTPESSIPTINEVGITDEDLKEYIQTRCEIFASGKMREVDFSLENLEGLIEDTISYYPDYHNKQPLLFWGFLGFGVICEIIVYLTAWRSLFNSSVFWSIILGLALWAIIAVSFFFLCYVLTTSVTFLANLPIRYRIEKILLHMEALDSVNIRLTNIYTQQRKYESEQWKKKLDKKSKTNLDTFSNSSLKTNENQGVTLNSWPLLEFARLHGKMQIGPFVNKTTNVSSKICLFTNESGHKTYVSFDKRLGELTSSQIIQLKNDLKVVELENGKFVLQKKD